MNSNYQQQYGPEIYTTYPLNNTNFQDTQWNSNQQQQDGQEIYSNSLSSPLNLQDLAAISISMDQPIVPNLCTNKPFVNGNMPAGILNAPTMQDESVANEINNGDCNNGYIIPNDDNSLQEQHPVRNQVKKTLQKAGDKRKRPTTTNLDEGDDKDEEERRLKDKKLKSIVACRNSRKNRAEKEGKMKLTIQSLEAKTAQLQNEKIDLQKSVIYWQTSYITLLAEKGRIEIENEKLKIKCENKHI